MMIFDDLELILFSIRGALVATLIASLFALPVAYALEFKRFWCKPLLEIISILPLGVPPVIIGYMLLILFSPKYFLGSFIYSVTGSSLVFTWIAGSLASAIVSFPLIVRSFQLGFSSIDNNLVNTARSLGLSFPQIFTKVIYPLSKKGMFAGLLICFARSISEFGATIVVSGNMPGKTQNISTAIYTSISSADNSSVIRLSFYSILMAILSITVHNILVNRKSR